MAFSLPLRFHHGVQAVFIGFQLLEREHLASVIERREI